MATPSGHRLNHNSNASSSNAYADSKTTWTPLNGFLRLLQGRGLSNGKKTTSHLPSRPTSGSQHLVGLKDSSSLAQVVESAPEPGVHTRKRTRSKSPEKSSSAKKGRAIVQHDIRTLPTFQQFDYPEVDVVQITREQFIKLQTWAGDKAEYLLSKNDATGWDVLLDPIIQQRILQGKSNNNSDYENTQVVMSDLRPWKDFPTFIEIESFSKSSANLKHLFHKIMLPNAGRKMWYEELLNDPGYIPGTEETSFIRNTHAFFAQLNALIRFTCTGPTSRSANCVEGLSPDKWITIGGGKCAMKRRKEGHPENKVPDLAAYWTDGDDSHLDVKSPKSDHPASQMDCLLVGDFKMATKFNHTMLTSKGGRFKPEGKKVMNQIHDYMDMHHNRFGYIITQKELIMFRRRDDPPEKWGQLDYSPSIPVSSERGKINAMMVLWYFHIKYGVMELEGGWKLPSAYHNCPQELLGKSAIIKEATPKKATPKKATPTKKPI
jgi:hypothetical protein